jgi:hypothetical protein
MLNREFAEMLDFRVLRAKNVRMPTDPEASYLLSDSAESAPDSHDHDILALEDLSAHSSWHPAQAIWAAAARLEVDDIG